MPAAPAPVGAFAAWPASGAEGAEAGVITPVTFPGAGASGW